VNRLILAPLALEDLEKIGEYIALDNLAAAQTFVERLRVRCYALGKNPGIGHKRDEIRPGLRSLAEGNYLILYRSHANYVEIVRVVHGKRDLAKVFEKDSEG